MEALPFVDEHSQPVGAPADAVWAALLRVLGRWFGGGGSVRFARALRCEPLVSTAPFAGRTGETLPGFQVVDSEPGRRLELRGRHRFARYALSVRLEGGRLVAQTHAAFPGLRGALYRVVVIGSGGHRIIVRRLLAAVAKASERGRASPGASS